MKEKLENINKNITAFPVNIVDYMCYDRNLNVLESCMRSLFDLAFENKKKPNQYNGEINGFDVRIGFNPKEERPYTLYINQISSYSFYENGSGVDLDGAYNKPLNAVKLMFAAKAIVDVLEQNGK